MNTVQRTAQATWKGTVEKGRGLLTTESKTLVESPFTLGCRLDGESSEEVNPEELLAAAAASCFSMALSKTLSDRGKTPETLLTSSRVNLSVDDDGPMLDSLELRAEGLVPGMSEEEFNQAVEETRESCPVYRLLEPGFKKVVVESALQT